MSSHIASQDSIVLDRLLDPIRDALNPEVARAISALRADAATQDRLDDLAERHHEGQLSPEELGEYQSLVNGINMISIIQAKARSVINTRRPG